MSGEKVELEVEEAFAIADRIVEMAGKLRLADRLALGAAAKWHVTIDGIRYKVVLSAAEQVPAT